jgi:hypothetical protein
MLDLRPRGDTLPADANGGIKPGSGPMQRIHGRQGFGGVTAGYAAIGVTKGSGVERAKSGIKVHATCDGGAMGGAPAAPHWLSRVGQAWRTISR